MCAKGRQSQPCQGKLRASFIVQCCIFVFYCCSEIYKFSIATKIKFNYRLAINFSQFFPFCLSATSDRIDIHKWVSIFFFIHFPSEHPWRQEYCNSRRRGIQFCRNLSTVNVPHSIHTWHIASAHPAIANVQLQWRMNNKKIQTIFCCCFCSPSTWFCFCLACFLLFFPQSILSNAFAHIQFELHLCWQIFFPPKCYQSDCQFSLDGWAAPER